MIHAVDNTQASTLTPSSVSTKITEITGKSACVVWCPINSHPDVIALGAKVCLIQLQFYFF